MTALAHALSRASGVEIEVESLKVVVIFSGLGMLVSLFYLTYGLVLSPGLF